MIIFEWSSNDNTGNMTQQNRCSLKVLTQMLLTVLLITSDLVTGSQEAAITVLALYLSWG